MNSMLIGRGFCRLLAVGRLLHRKFCWFWLFLRDFDFLDNLEYPKCSPQTVRNKGGLWTGRFWPVPINSPQILETATTGKNLRVTWLTCNSGVIPGTGATAGRNGPISVVDFGHNVFCLNVDFLKFIHRRISVSNGRVLFQKFSSFSAYTSIKNVGCKTEQPFLSGV